MTASVSRQSGASVARRFSKSLPDLKSESERRTTKTTGTTRPTTTTTTDNNNSNNNNNSESETSVHLNGFEPAFKSILQMRRAKSTSFEDPASSNNLLDSKVASNDSLLSDFTVLLDDLSLRMRDEARTNFAKLEQTLDRFAALMENPSRQHLRKVSFQVDEPSGLPHSSTEMPVEPPICGKNNNNENSPVLGPRSMSAPIPASSGPHPNAPGPHGMTEDGFQKQFNPWGRCISSESNDDTLGRGESKQNVRTTHIKFQRSGSATNSIASSTAGFSISKSYASQYDPTQFTQMLRKTRSRSQWEISAWQFLEDPDLVKGGRRFVQLMSFAIIISTLIPVLQTITPQPIDPYIASVEEMTLDCFFVLEFAMRFKVCPNRVAFWLNPFNLVDLIASVFPLVVRLSSRGAEDLTRAADDGDYLLMVFICAIPQLRFLKLIRRFETVHLMLQAFRDTLTALPLLMYILCLLVLFFSSAIYISEPRSNIGTMPEAIWLTIVTVGTIGYGDKTPESMPGYIAVSVLIVVSALYMAIPIGIVGKAFVSVWDIRDRLLLLHRARSRFLAGGYFAQDIPKMFCTFDTNQNGELEIAEFESMMRNMEIEVDTEQIRTLFGLFDEDGSGGIADEQFVKTLFPENFHAMYGDEEAEAMYSQGDAVPEEPEEEQPQQSRLAMAGRAFGKLFSRAPPTAETQCVPDFSPDLSATQS
ncbi:unnamed protein product [Polarella glacialis]|uniref:EF-hand domain-containing protein n=1 Tax=Polarella glacialis TaxID=89957 RepID=A0A813JLV8_POLGL|nr:unnamed protein product [Polarella glacialis]